jgi:glycosyltransferase involved in cell wall biosynthesis
MLEGRDLIIFGGDWNRFPNGFQQIAEILAQKNRVLWVGSVSIRSPKLQAYDFNRIKGRFVDLFKVRHEQRKKMLAANIYPVVLPFYDMPGIQKINDALVRCAVRKKIKELGFQNIISFPSTPMVADIIGTLNESSIHYFCMDDYTQYDGVYRCVGPLEKRMLEKVDSCFAVSEPLLQTRKARTGENHYFHMGVDIAHFEQNGNSIPEELKTIKKPIAGFFGQIGTYVDVELIVQCAKTYPRASFVVIGRPHIHVDISILSQSRNIYFLGEVPYERIPIYAQMFDVGLNPRVVNKLSLSMNPAKLMEYLSMGMPVVSTDLPAVRKFVDYVYIAKSRKHFVELVGTALSEASKEKREARKKIARQYSWKSITEGISDIIDRIDMQKVHKT